MSKRRSVNIDQITPQTTTQLKAWCKENEINPRTLTPKTDYATKYLGFDTSDICSRRHKWKYSEKTAPDRHQVEEFMYWHYLAQNLKDLQETRQKVIDQNLMNLDKANMKKMDDQIMQSVIDKANKEFERVITKNRQKLNQIYVEQELAFEQSIKQKKRDMAQRQKEIRLRNEQLRKEQELERKRELEKQKKLKVKQQQEQRERERAQLSITWLDENTTYLKEKRIRESRRRQMILSKQHCERNEYLKNMRRASLKKQYVEVEKGKQLQSKNDHHYNLWIKNIRKRKDYWKEKLSKRRKSMDERAKLLKAKKRLQKKKILREMEMRERTLHQFNRSKSMMLKEKAAVKEKHRTKVIRKNADQSSEMIKMMLLKQNQADERRQQYQAQREKEAAMKQTLFLQKKLQTETKLKRLQRIKEFQNAQRLEKIKIRDKLRQKEKNLKDAVLTYKLKSNEKFKEELETARWLGNMGSSKLRKLEAETESKKFGLEMLDKKKLIKLMTSTPRSARGPKSGVAANAERKKLTMRYAKRYDEIDDEE